MLNNLTQNERSNMPQSFGNGYFYEKNVLQNQQFQFDLARKTFDYECKCNQMLLKHDLEMKKEATREETRQNRELSQFCGFENADGKFCIEYRFPNRPSKYSNPIFDITCIRMIKEVTKLGNFYHIFWKENSQGIVISEAEMDTKKLKKALEKNGVIFKISREKKQEVAEQLVDFLYSNLVEKEIPILFGWNKMREGWIFNSEVK